MSDSNAEPVRTWSTEFVERTIKQPVREAVREVLTEHEGRETAGDTAERHPTADADEAATDTDADEEHADDTDGANTEDDPSTRPSAPRLLLLAGGLAGIAYAATRWRRSDDDQAENAHESDGAGDADDADEADETATEDGGDDSDERADGSAHDSESEDPIRDGERSTAPTEDATAN